MVRITPLLLIRSLSLVEKSNQALSDVQLPDAWSSLGQACSAAHRAADTFAYGVDLVPVTIPDSTTCLLVYHHFMLGQVNSDSSAHSNTGRVVNSKAMLCSVVHFSKKYGSTRA